MWNKGRISSGNCYYIIVQYIIFLDKCEKNSGNSALFCSERQVKGFVHWIYWLFYLGCFCSRNFLKGFEEISNVWPPWQWKKCHNCYFIKQKASGVYQKWVLAHVGQNEYWDGWPVGTVFPWSKPSPPLPWWESSFIPTLLPSQISTNVSPLRFSSACTCVLTIIHTRTGFVLYYTDRRETN